jgi:hypothetical protein
LCTAEHFGYRRGLAVAYLDAATTARTTALACTENLSVGEAMWELRQAISAAILERKAELDMQEDTHGNDRTPSTD